MEQKKDSEKALSNKIEEAKVMLHDMYPKMVNLSVEEVPAENIRGVKKRRNIFRRTKEVPTNEVSDVLLLITNVDNSHQSKMSYLDLEKRYEHKRYEAAVERKKKRIDLFIYMPKEQEDCSPVNLFMRAI